MGNDTLDWYFELGDLIIDEVVIRGVFRIDEKEDITWPGVVMIMTPTPMKAEFPDAGHLFKAGHLPSLHLSLQVTRGQFSDMLRMLETKLAWNDSHTRL